MSARVYERKFDWDEARKLRASGWTYQRIADRYGVSDTAIFFVCNDDARARNQERIKAWTMAGVCEECGGACVRAGHGARTRHAAADGRVLCRRCRGKMMRTGLAVRDGVIHVRCGSCRTEKPLTEFGPRTAHAVIAGTRLKKTCRACEAEKRQAYRERHKVPCRECGNPCLAANDKGRRGKDTQLCLGCYQRSRKAA